MEIAETIARGRHGAAGASRARAVVHLAASARAALAALALAALALAATTPAASAADAARSDVAAATSAQSPPVGDTADEAPDTGTGTTGGGRPKPPVCTLRVKAVATTLCGSRCRQYRICDDGIAEPLACVPPPCAS